MAEEAAAPARVVKKKKKKKSDPSVGELIVRAVSACREQKCVSGAALKKALAAAGYDVEKNKTRFNNAIKSLVTKGTLVQTKGSGASGSYKINKKAEAKSKKPVKKAAPKAKQPAANKKPAAKSPKKVVKKAPAAKKE